MNFCKSCSFEAISARWFKRSSLSVMREKYSSRSYFFRPLILLPEGNQVAAAIPLLRGDFTCAA